MKPRFLKNTLCGIAVLLCVLVAAILPEGVAWAEPAQPADIDAVVIRSASLGLGTRGKKNGAVLLTSPAEIERHKALFLDNQQLQHACGYTYDLEFWSGTTVHDVIQYNIECGEEFARDTAAIASLMEQYNRQFLAGAVATIHAVQVPVDQDPQTLIQAMRQDGLSVFPVDGLYARYPSLLLSFTFQGKDSSTLEPGAITAMQLFLDNWPPSIPQSVTYTPASFVGGSYSQGRTQITVATTVWFPLGTDLQQIAVALATPTSTVTRLNTPEYYPIYLISPETNRRTIEKLLLHYPGLRLF